MARYHVNYDGYILPCRAKVRPCPYGSDRHGRSPEELYAKVQSEYSPEIDLPSEIRGPIDAGFVLNLGEEVSEEIAKSTTPVETFLGILKYARGAEEASQLPDRLRRKERALIDLSYSCYEHSISQPKNMPYYISKQAREKWERDGSNQKGAWSFGNERKTRQIRDREEYLSEDIADFREWEKTHNILTREEQADYREGLRGDYNFYSKAFNLSKVIEKASWPVGKTEEQVTKSMKYMSDMELFSLNDALSVDDGELEKTLRDVHYFRGIGGSQLSDEAKVAIESWYNKFQVGARKILDSPADRLFASVIVNKELSRRKLL